MLRRSRRIHPAALLALALDLGAGAAPAEEPPLATDRPGNALAATTVPRLRLQVEGSALYALERQPGSDPYNLSFPTLLRFGLLDRLELRLRSAVVGVEAEGGEASAHPTDLAPGLKVQMMRARGWRPDLAVSLDVLLPAGTGPFTGDIVAPEARLEVAWGLPGGFGLLVNAGSDRIRRGDGRRQVRLVYAANASWTAPVAQERLFVFVEAFGRAAFARAAFDQALFDWGAAFRLGDNWQVDASLQHALNAAPPDLQLSLGLSARL